MREGFARACAGDGTLILIEGPAGVGKTELAREARAAAEDARLMALQARGSELEEPFAFGVVRQLLEPVIDGASGHPDLFAGAAGPAARLFEGDERQSPGADAGFEALHSLYWLVVNLADRAPVLVLVDDCQWADRDSLRFLAYLAQRIEGLPIAMLLAGRPMVEEAGSLWAQVASRPAAVALYPRPLSEPAAAALARERLGADAAEEFCHACHTATGGNPLFLRELLRALDAAGVVPSAAAANEVQTVGPAAVSRFVLHRLATLGPAASELAKAVAVLGDDSELQLAAGVAGLTDDGARAAADDLVRADIFVRAVAAGVRPPDRARRAVRGPRARRTAGATRRGGRRAGTRGRPGGAPHRTPALDRRDGGPAQGRRRSGPPPPVPPGAARRARPRCGSVRALAESPGEQERAEILAELGRCEVAAMQFEAAEEHLRAAVASGATLATRADAASTLARCAIVSGGHSAEAAAEALSSLVEALRPSDPERSLELGAELLALTPDRRAPPKRSPGAPGVVRVNRRAVTPASRPWRASTPPSSSSTREGRRLPP